LKDRDAEIETLHEGKAKDHSTQLELKGKIAQKDAIIEALKQSELELEDAVEGTTEALKRKNAEIATLSDGRRAIVEELDENRKAMAAQRLGFIDTAQRLKEALQQLERERRHKCCKAATQCANDGKNAAKEKELSERSETPNSKVDTRAVSLMRLTTVELKDGETELDGDGDSLDELHCVGAMELGEFVRKQMSTKTLNRLWTHLDEDDSGEIERTELLNILQWMAVLYVAFRFRKRGGHGQPQIDKAKLKLQFVPVKEWILKHKMDTKSVVTRDEFRQTFGAWLKEYGQKHKI